MERTTIPNKPNITNIGFDINEEPIVLSKHLMDLLLEQPNSINLIGLYSFYYYMAKWQQTNQPKVINFYVQKRLNWGKGKVEKYKGQLIKLGLIENITKHAYGRIIGNYIKVNFIWTKTKAEEIQNKNIGGRVLMEEENRGVILKVNYIGSDTLFPNEFTTEPNNPTTEQNKIYLSIAKYLASIILSKKNVKVTTQNITTWAKEIQKLVEVNNVSIKRIKTALLWYEQKIGQPYVPVIESGRTLREKFIKLEDAMKRDEEPKKDLHPMKFGYDNRGYWWDEEKHGYYNKANERLFE